MLATHPFKTICFSILLYSISPPAAPAQQLSHPSTFDQSTAWLQRFVPGEPGSDSRLYNGDEYIRNGTHAKGFPFFDADSLLTGSLLYDGILYTGIPLEYDLVLDKVIIRDHSGKELISLISEKIDHFSIGDHYFRYVSADKAGAPDRSAPPVPGFYEVLYASGATTILARREKKLIFPSNRDDIARYEQNNRYFLRFNDRFYKVDGKNALLDAFHDKKEALKKYIRQNKIRFSKHPEPALIHTTAYYMQLSH